jgi:hypothetical protein
MNPFVYGAPVKPDQFIGRRRETITVLNRLLNPNDRGSSAVSGANRLGKTSFLQYLMCAARAAPWELPPETSHFVFLDCSAIPLDDNGLFNGTEFWRYVLRALARVLPAQLKNHTEEILKSRDVLDTFELNTLFQNVAASGNMVTLLLDEFEYLVEHSSPANPRLLYTLKALINLPAPRGLALVTASRETLSALSSRLRWIGSPFHSNFAFVPLKPFNQDEVNELIDRYLENTGVEFSLEDRQVMHQISNGYPEQVQYACWLLFDKKTGS